MLDGRELHDLLSRLVRMHERGTGYSLESLPADFVEKEMKGTVGFALDVTRVDTAYKLSQNRDDESYATIVRELEHRDDEASMEIAGEMKKRRSAVFLDETPSSE
jgi:transcriptional regulator